VDIAESFRDIARRFKDNGQEDWAHPFPNNR